ncbi:hypothetical protein G9A89_011409 [Geosiphon pyriformis]|nr:hypothetical protein G9A89_011409 [Geosiphon pyriformis]
MPDLNNHARYLTDTGKLGEQIYHKLLGYLTNTTTQAIAETLCIIDTNIKHYMKKRFPQVNQPGELDSERDESGFNSTTEKKQAQSTVNKKPKLLSLTTLSYYQTSQSRIVLNSPPETPQTSGNSYPWGHHS